MRQSTTYRNQPQRGRQTMRTINKLIATGVLAATLALAAPTTAYACDSGLLGWLVGCDPAGLNSTAIEQSQIDADRRRRIAEVESAANVQIQQAQQQIELFRTQSAADERRHQAELERMQQQLNAYVAMVQAQAQERVATIHGDYQTAQVALQEQSEIAVAGINGTTSVATARIVWRGLVTLGLIVLAGVLAVLLLPLLVRRGRVPAQPRLQRPAAYYWQVEEQGVNHDIQLR